jgi:thioester reductase-like protein
MENLAADLGRFAATQPDAVLYSFLDGAGRIVESYTYRGFDERTNFVAAALLHSGKVAPGDRVLLVYAPGLEFIVAFFACVKLGAIPVPVPPPNASGLAGGLERLAHVAADCGAAVALTSDSYRELLQSFAGRSQDAAIWLGAAPLSTLEWVSTSPLTGALQHFELRTSPLLFLQYTSGSTQSPRGVMVTHDNVRHNCRATMTHRPVAVSWLPQYHDMGLIGYYLYVLLTGGATYGFAAANFLKRPLLWFETISKYRGTITSAPNFAFEYCLREDRVPTSRLTGVDLSSMLCMMNASEPVRAATYRRFLDRFAPYGLAPASSVVFYGLAENTLSVTGQGRRHLTVNTALLEQNHLRIEEPRPDLVNQSLIASCGRPLTGVEVLIVDTAIPTPLGEGGIGEVWIAGGSKTLGYWNNPALTRKSFEASHDGGAGDYLRTGDVGFFHEGELFICGRLKDLVIIGGRNHYPADVEAVIERASPKVRLGCVAAFGVDRQDEGEGIVVLAEAHRANDLPDLEELARAVRKHCHVEIDVLGIVAHGTIIKTSSGKIARQACRRAWESGAIAVIASRVSAPRAAPSSPLEELLDRFDDEEADDERTLADLGVDSVTLVELSLRMERIWRDANPSGDHQQTDDALFDLRVLQAATLGELRAFVKEFTVGENVPELARGLYLARQAAIDADQVRQMRSDARLPLDISPQPARHDLVREDQGHRELGRRDVDRRDPVERVLLTGGTGFLGSYLLEALLRLTDCEVVVLARAEDDGHALTRVESALHKTGLMDASLRERFDARVSARRGDLRLARLGLGDAAWDELGDTLSGIYHCGAEVDYVQPYEHLRDVNVTSTIALLELAASIRPKRFHYVSTTFMFGFVAREICSERDSNAEMEGLNFGYSQSKWVAEQLVLDAMERGLSARIYRPSLISASATGRYAKGDLMARVFAYMIRHGLSVDTANQVSLLPVDVCANNIVALSRLDAPAATTVHLTADSYYTMRDACMAITAAHGYSFDYISLEAFIAHMNAHCTKHDLLYPLMAFFNQNFRRILAMRDKRYDNRHYREERARAADTLPEPPLGAVVGGIVDFLQTEHLVPAPPVRSVSVI